MATARTTRCQRRTVNGSPTASSAAHRLAFGSRNSHSASTSSPPRTRHPYGPLERSQEVDDVLLLLSPQPVEAPDDSVGFAARASVRSDGLYKVGRASVMEEEDALPDTPEWSCSEFIGAGATLCDAVRESSAHVMNEEVGEEVYLLVRKRSTRIRRGAACNLLGGDKRRRVAEGTAYLYESGPSIRSRRRVRSGSGRGQHPHEVGKRLDV